MCLCRHNGNVVARESQPLDRAALMYLKQKFADSGMTRPALAERSGIPYQTLRGWWDSTKSPALSLADVRNLLNGLGIPPEQGFEEIQRLEVAMQDSAD